jgi:SWI/SNF-related matrix-associated actin-dependent regulator 1 of chromatin subfamily A
MASNHSPKQKKNPIPHWRRQVGPVASVFREGHTLKIDFQYSPERVSSVKALKGARYNPNDKSWSLPRDRISDLLALRDFPSNAILNALGPEDTESLLPDAALDELRGDPFLVREEVLASVALDLIVRFSPEKRRVRFIPRFGSTAHKVLKKFPGATFSAFDNAFVIPVERIAELLKKLRDKQALFGIDSAAGAALSGSAALRKQILSNPENANADDLSATLLTPFITESKGEGAGYRPCYFTTEQFSQAFPGIRRQAGKVFLLDDRGLLRFFARRASLPFPVWMTSEVHARIKERRDQLATELKTSSGALDDVAAEIMTIPLLWRTSERKRAQFVVNLPKGTETRELLRTRLEETLSTEYVDLGESLTIEVPDSRLLVAVGEVDTICQQHSLGIIPRSESFDRLLSDVRNRVRLREKVAYFSTIEDVDSAHLPGLPADAATRLFPHQRIAVQWLRDTPYAFLGDDMGLGKTLSVLSYFSSLKSTDYYSLLLVICPNSLSRNWAREATMWFPELRATVLAGDKAAKAWSLRLLNSRAIEQDVLVVNYEAVRLDYIAPELQKLVSERKTLLCLDESQRVKNPSAKTFKAISSISPGCDRRVLLSGTPMPKDVTDLWAQMRILDGGERFGRSYYKWLHTIAELGTEYSQFAIKNFHDAEVQESVCRVHEIMLRRRKERVVNLPPKTFSLREVELVGSQRERYDEIREGLILRMRSLSGEQFTREITNILEEYLRAVQVSSNPRLIDPEWKGEPAKFLELDEIVDEVVRQQGQKIVLWTNYLGNVSELCERYKDLGTAPFSGEVSPADREVTIRGFQSGDSPSILVAVPAAGGVGITLTAAQTAVYIEKTWNAEHWMQSVDRLHRIGQRGTVNIISLLSCKVDEIIHWNLRRKEQGQARVLGDYDVSGSQGLAGVTREELLKALED